MTHSIRLGLVDRLKRVIDHVAKHLVQKLRGAEVHPNATEHVCIRFIGGVNHPGCERQVDNAVGLSRFRDEVHEANRAASIRYFPSAVPNRQEPPAFHNYLVSHPNPPQPKNLIVWPATSGVQRPDIFGEAAESERVS